MKDILLFCIIISLAIPSFIAGYEHQEKHYRESEGNCVHCCMYRQLKITVVPGEE